MGDACGSVILRPGKVKLRNLKIQWFCVKEMKNVGEKRKLPGKLWYRDNGEEKREKWEKSFTTGCVVA